ncbi:reticulon-like protein B13 [Hibiscus syriacus]|uniref:reticulon-like protein B13 n=1 Tax=Hibiscus syriacus TaxID=106335 RepID=UPI001924C6C8|nr:reticulon-like protein B13 [Hibiscus syriacus]
MEEKEGERNTSSRFNSDMGIRSLSVQLHHCRFMADHLHPRFGFPLGKHSELLGKEPPKCPIWSYRNRQPWRLQTSRTVMEDVLRWMFRVTVEENWFVFARTLAGLLLLSYVGTFFDFLTLVYIGITVLMTVPLIYMKYGDHIKRHGERVKGRMRRF